MKKLSLLVFSAVLAVFAASCTKENASEIPDEKDSKKEEQPEQPQEHQEPQNPLQEFTGIEVEVGEQNGSSKLFILNEGAYPGASTLDLLDFTSKKYYADFFGQANPSVAQGLGNTGNDMALVDGKLWVLLNASNQLAILEVPSCKLLKVVEVDAPRYITASGDYAYVSSYGAAVYGGDPVNGKVYRIHKGSYETSAVEVGYQPEGLAVLDGKLYVANSGGYNLQHDNRVSVIDLAGFKLEKQLELPATNLNLLFAACGKLWMNTYGESSWSQDNDGNWVASVSAPMCLLSFDTAGSSNEIPNVHAEKMTLCGDYIYAFGNADEMGGGYDYCLYKVNTTSAAVESATHFQASDLSRVSYAYGLLVNPDNGDIYICDASFTGGSKLHCFNAALQWKWTVDTGVGTGHLLLN